MNEYDTAGLSSSASFTGSCASATGCAYGRGSGSAAAL